MSDIPIVGHRPPLCKKCGEYKYECGCEPRSSANYEVLHYLLMDKLKRTSEDWIAHADKLRMIASDGRLPNGTRSGLRAKARAISACINDLKYIIARNKPKEMTNE